ncbi:hypothetical protein BHE74_00055887 [Ensete ventricosum]|nr:hypothetical protein BHE74_00055887 [Ensete ventricosum]
MPPQAQAPVNDADFEQMPMNLKEGDCYVVNHSEGLTAVDFGGHVSLAEKEGAGMAERRSDTGHAGCSRGRGCNCEAAVEKAAALAFGVVEATGEGVERCRGDQRRSGVGSCPTWR